jgi:hypothetical protein
MSGPYADSEAASPADLKGLIRELGGSDAGSRWVHGNFRRLVELAITREKPEAVIEIEGGRAPLLGVDVQQQDPFRYVITDVDPQELDLAPSHVSGITISAKHRDTGSLFVDVSSA